MLTADTITDDQIKEMRRNTGWKGPRCEADHKMLRAALHGDRASRQRCADILNAKEMHCRGRVCAYGHGHCECECESCLQADEILKRP